jgi:hypothetical protein
MKHFKRHKEYGFLVKTYRFWNFSVGHIGVFQCYEIRHFHLSGNFLLFISLYGFIQNQLLYSKSAFLVALVFNNI